MSNSWVGSFQQWLSESQSLKNAQNVVDHFKGSGWSRNALSAMLGNMRHESSINPDMYEYGYDWDANRGYGLVQWTPRSKYWDWATARGLSPRLGSSQLARIDFEADNNIQWIQTNSYPLSFAEFRKSTQSVDYLTQAFTWNYERPNATAGANSMPARIAFAKKCYNQLDWTGQVSNPTDPTLPPDPTDPTLPPLPPPVGSGWKTSAAEMVEILWTPFETTVPVNPEKELLSVTYKVINTENFPVYFDDLTLEKNLLNDKLMAAETTYIPFEGVAAGVPLNRTVFAGIDVTKIVSIHYVPEETITGSNTDYAQLQIINDPDGEILTTKTFVDGVINKEKLVFDFGPVSPRTAVIAPGTSLRLTKQEAGNGMKIPRGVLIIRWDIA